MLPYGTNQLQIKTTEHKNQNIKIAQKSREEITEKNMAKTGVTGFKRIINAAGYSWLGFKAAYTHEAAFRQELWLTIFLAPAAFYLGNTLFEKAILLSTLLLVLIVELLNSALEAIVDRISDDHHELSGRAKDMGSSAVLLAIVVMVICWGSIIVENYSLY